MGFIIYLALGYWAVGQTVFRNKVLIGTWTTIVIEKLAIALFLGFILIPVAVIRMIVSR